MLDYSFLAEQASSEQLDTDNLIQVAQTVPAMAKQMAPQDPREVQKAWRTRSREKAGRAPKSYFFDPLSLQYALGYKDRRYNLTYDMLKRIANQLSVISAIINTRIAQIASFSQPYRQTKSLGYAVKHKDPEHETTASERRFIQQLEAFVGCCGEPGKENPFTRVKRDKFESFLKKIVRDTLTYDQISFEVIPRNNQIPFEFRAVDASTIRIASPERDAGTAHSRTYHQRNTIVGMTGPQPYRFSSLYQGTQYGSLPDRLETVQYVQLINGQIENVYGQELAFGVRNPRTDIYIQGYGFGELEQLVTITTSLLWAEEFNRRFFNNGAHPKGILNFKGDNWTPDQLESFKKQWIAQVAGTSNSWKTPITQSEGIEWVNMQMSNQDMQFNVWIEYLIKIASAVFLIDPAEINFDLHGGVQQTPLFESSQEWKLKASRDRGLKPLLRFIAGLINDYVIDKIDDHFVFEFAGLDELTEQEKHEMIKEQTSSYMTLNEGRRSLDLPDIPEVGDLPLNPTLIQLFQFMDQRKEREEQQLKEQQEQELAQQQQAMQEQQGQQEEQDPAMQQAQMRVAHTQQKMQQDAEKHPLELEAMRQKLGLAQQEGMPQEGMPAEGQEMVPQEGMPEEQPVEQSPYADLVGKSRKPSASFDEWLEEHRNKKDG
jgi:hypothetical protein